MVKKYLTGGVNEKGSLERGEKHQLEIKVGRQLMTDSAMASKQEMQC